MRSTATRVEIPRQDAAINMGLERKKIAVAMSGGVDSSVTAALLLERGYDVVGVSLRLWEGERAGPRNCSDHVGARDVAKFLGVPHWVLDQRAAFRASVAQSFANEYAAGRTPNPCVACNRDFKLGGLMAWAESRGIAHVATGHYARLQRTQDRISLWRGADRMKDQSYFLFALSQQQLARTVFPLGTWTKEQVRCRARALGLAVADRAESQDICFGNHRTLVESLTEDVALDCGDIVDTTGKVLGRHGGIHRFTVGQRRGLGVSAGVPLYVRGIEPSRNRVVVGPKEELVCRRFSASRVNWICPPESQEFEALVQIRYRANSVPCIVHVVEKANVEIEFLEEYPAVTPGQAAVLYRGNELLGGGWIDRAFA